MLKQIQQYEEISPLIRKFFKPSVQTNHFMSEREYRTSIENKSLYYYEIADNIIFLKKREANYKLTYMLNNYKEIKIKEVLSNLDMPVVTEIVKRPACKNISEITSFFEKNNFNIELERYRMQLSENVVYDNNEESIKKICDTSNFYDINEMLNKNFSVHTGCIPNEIELKNDIEEGFVIGVFSNKGNLAGILHYSNNKSVYEIRHLVVDEMYRNKGVASLLIETYHEKILANKSKVWVSKNNNIAQSCYKKHGYEFDRMGIYSIYFKLKEGSLFDGKN